jgi:L-alanine-DL-glutamate epimerase-like enolase superfamily enzyme
VDSLLVKVTTDQGQEGWGESFGFTAVPVTQRAVDAVIAPLCIGQDATRIGPLMSEVQEKLSVSGRGGPFTHGLSAVDIALWDIAGKAAGAPAAPPAGRRPRRAGLLREPGCLRRP